MQESYSDSIWPALPLSEWVDTYSTLHMWMQIVGKIRLKLSPMVNHWWQVPLYLTTNGLTTSPIPYDKKLFQIDFDFKNHKLQISTNTGESRTINLEPKTVVDFYSEVMNNLESLGIKVHIWTNPVEVTEAIPFEKDTRHYSYDSKYVERFWQILLQTDRVFKDFRAKFQGKASPVHFFWGAFDHAVTRFSGRTAPEHPGGVPNVARSVMIEAYSHEVSSCGFWPGAGLGYPAFYSYAYPEAEGFREYKVEPQEAYYNTELREFILPYDVVRNSPDPDKTLLLFLQSTYEAAANTANLDRNILERKKG